MSSHTCTLLRWFVVRLLSLYLIVCVPELLTTVGLLYLRLGENYKAFEYLGNSLTHDPKNAKVRHD